MEGLIVTRNLDGWLVICFDTSQKKLVSPDDRYYLCACIHCDKTYWLRAGVADEVAGDRLAEMETHCPACLEEEDLARTKTYLALRESVLEFFQERMRIMRLNREGRPEGEGREDQGIGLESDEGTGIITGFVPTDREKEEH